MDALFSGLASLSPDEFAAQLALAASGGLLPSLPPQQLATFENDSDALDDAREEAEYASFLERGGIFGCVRSRLCVAQRRHLTHLSTLPSCRRDREAELRSWRRQRADRRAFEASLARDRGFSRGSAEWNFLVCRFAESQRLADEEGLGDGSDAHAEALREWEEENEDLLLVDGDLSLEARSSLRCSPTVNTAGAERPAMVTAAQCAASSIWPVPTPSLASLAPAFVPLSAFLCSAAPVLSASSAEFVPPSTFASSEPLASSYSSAERGSFLMGSSRNPGGIAWQDASACVPPDQWAPAPGSASL
jgi:hypothetical protein